MIMTEKEFERKWKERENLHAALADMTDQMRRIWQEVDELRQRLAKIEFSLCDKNEPACECKPPRFVG